MGRRPEGTFSKWLRPRWGQGVGYGTGSKTRQHGDQWWEPHLMKNQVG